MGIIMPETCWVNENKHLYLWHLVGSFLSYIMDSIRALTYAFLFILQVDALQSGHWCLISNFVCLPCKVWLAVSQFLTLSYPLECATISLVWLIPPGEHFRKCMSQGETFHSVISFMLAKSIDFVRRPWCHIVRKVFEIKKRVCWWQWLYAKCLRPCIERREKYNTTHPTLMYT